MLEWTRSPSLAEPLPRGAPSEAASRPPDFEADHDPVDADASRSVRTHDVSTGPRRDPSIQLIGTPHLRFGDGATRLLERRDAALLALLALLALQGPTDRARAARFLYPDLDDKQARSQLRQRLFRLKRLARRDVVTAVDALRIVDDVAIDVDALDHVLARDAAGCSGELLGDIDYSDVDTIDEWLRAARHAWRERRNDRLAAIASDLEKRHELAAALRYATRLVAEAPTAEHAHRRLMRLHYLRGDRSRAHDAFGHCVRVLDDELGIEPDRETLELASQIGSATFDRARPGPRPLALIHPPRIVGRDQRHGWLARAVQKRRALILRGEAGLGKSRILDDFAQSTDGAIVVGARLGDARFGYASASRLVRALASAYGCPDTPWIGSELSRIAAGPFAGASPPPGALDPGRLLQATHAALRFWTAGGLSLVCVDDLHHADDASLELLAPLVAESTVAGPAWVFATRGSESSASVQQWIDAALGAHADCHDLRPLEVSSIGQLLASLAVPGLDTGKWAAALCRRTGGNPFFILETLRALVEHGEPLPVVPPETLPYPAHIGALIHRRLATVGPTSRDLLRVAAIAGDDFSVELAAKVMQQTVVQIAGPLQELEATDVLRDGHFAHDLVLEEALRSIPDAVAQVLHRQIAGALQEQGVASRRLASHWQAAGEWKAAGDEFTRAARDARTTSRTVEALSLWDRAIACYRHGGAVDQAFDASCESITSRIASRPLQETLDLTMRLCEDARTDAQRLEALLSRATALCTAGRFDQASHVGEAAGRLATRLDLPWKRFDATRLTSMALAVEGEPAKGSEALRAFETQVRTDGTPLHRLHYWTDVGYILWIGNRRNAAVEAYREAARLAGHIGDIAELLVCESNIASLHGQLGRAREALDLSLRACRMVETTTGDKGVSVAIALINCGAAHAVLGEFDAALRKVEAGAALLTDAGSESYLPTCHDHLCNIYLQLGQFARARKALRPLPPAMPAEQRLNRATLEARLERCLGQAVATPRRPTIDASGFTQNAMQVLRARVHACRWSDPHSGWLECQRIRVDAEAMELLAVAMYATVVEVELLHRGGRHREAAALAIETSTRIDECRPVDLYWPEALVILAEAIEADRGTEDPTADALLRQAAMWVRETGLRHVPPAFRESFLERNDANRRVSRIAAQRFGLQLADTSLAAAVR